jgi:putative acetyltransferase
MTALVLRSERAGDIVAIREVDTVAFGQPNEARLVDELRNSEAFISELSIVAVAADCIVGHILITKAHIGCDDILALAPVAVLPEMQGKGVGSQLIREAIARAEKMEKFPAIVLLGHADYYPRFGFLRASQFGIAAPFPVPDEVYMVLPLNGRRPPSGVVSYPKAFEAV